MNESRYAEQLTAPGRGAVAVIRLRSSDLDVLDERFASASGKTPSTAAIGRILFGKWRAEEIVVVRTGDSDWEINCHGGEAAVNQILRDLAVPRSRKPQTIADSITAELLRCRSRRTANYLLAQSEGVFESFLRKLSSCRSADQAVGLIEPVLAWQAFATHLVTPWKVAIVGQPNAGKSSLLNALIGYERAIVFDQPGTTRDRIEAELIIDGWPVQAVDTAGIRETTDDVENAGVAAAKTSIADCDLCLLVIDSTIGWTEQDSEIAASIADNIPSALLFNKLDLSESGEDASAAAMGSAIKRFHISATSGDGLAELLEWIPKALLPRTPHVAEPLPVVPELTEALVQFKRSHDLQQLHNHLEDWLAR